MWLLRCRSLKADRCRCWARCARRWLRVLRVLGGARVLEVLRVRRVLAPLAPLHLGTDSTLAPRAQRALAPLAPARFASHRRGLLPRQPFIQPMQFVFVDELDF